MVLAQRNLPSAIQFRCIGIYEWEAALNVSTGKVHYLNNVNFSKVGHMHGCCHECAVILATGYGVSVASRTTCSSQLILSHAVDALLLITGGFHALQTLRLVERLAVPYINPHVFLRRTEMAERRGSLVAFSSIEQVPVLPACMDRLGDMSNLVTLKLSQNKLRSLPGRYIFRYAHLFDSKRVFYQRKM